MAEAILAALDVPTDAEYGGILAELKAAGKTIGSWDRTPGAREAAASQSLFSA